MSSPFANVFHLRTVAEASSKACYICHKPSTRVLITPDNKVGAMKRSLVMTCVYLVTACIGQPFSQDFFYICVSHLGDKGFASPVVDAEAEAARKKKELMDQEIEKIKQEYEEKQRKKKGKKKAKDDDKDKKKNDDDDDKAEKERDEKVGLGSYLDSQSPGPRKLKLNPADQSVADWCQFQRQVRRYSSHICVTQVTNPPDHSFLADSIRRNFYQMRVDRLRNMDVARRSQQRIKDPNLFPSVPKGNVQ